MGGKVLEKARLELLPEESGGFGELEGKGGGTWVMEAS